MLFLKEWAKPNCCAGTPAERWHCHSDCGLPYSGKWIIVGICAWTFGIAIRLSRAWVGLFEATDHVLACLVAAARWVGWQHCFVRRYWTARFSPRMTFFVHSCHSVAGRCTPGTSSCQRPVDDSLSQGMSWSKEGKGTEPTVPTVEVANKLIFDKRDGSQIDFLTVSFSVAL